MEAVAGKRLTCKVSWVWDQLAELVTERLSGGNSQGHTSNHRTAQGAVSEVCLVLGNLRMQAENHRVKVGLGGAVGRVW